MNRPYVYDVTQAQSGFPKGLGLGSVSLIRELEEGTGTAPQFADDKLTDGCKQSKVQTKVTQWLPEESRKYFLGAQRGTKILEFC